MSQTERILRERVDQLEEELRQMKAAAFPSDWFPPAHWGLHLTPAHLAILRALILRERASREYIFDFTREGACCWRKSEPSQKVIDVQVSRLRSALKPHGIRILTVWGYGYQLHPEDRERLRNAA